MTHIKVKEESTKHKKSESAEVPQESAEKENKSDLEAKENYDRYLRVSAELENYKKRVEKEKSEAYKFANENLLRDLIPVLDNLERAMEHGREADNPKALVEGIELTYKGFLAVLENHGISRVEALGEEFDPNHHEAVMVQEDVQSPPGMVISQLQTGYKLHNRLVRPAMVVVSKKPEINPDEDPEA